MLVHFEKTNLSCYAFPLLL